MRKVLKHIVYIFEGIVVWLFYCLLRVLPLDISSALCGRLMRLVGPHLRAAKTARDNLRMCFPHKSEAEIEAIMSRMWEHWGRVIGELPHIINLSSEEFTRRVDLSTLPSIQENALLLSGHLGNFEIATRLCLELEISVHFVYRPTNNPYVNFLIKRLREKKANKLITKGIAGIKPFIAVMERKEGIGMLVDQRMNDGVEITFFGTPARTTLFPAKLSLKYQVPIYMMWVKRLDGCKFSIQWQILNPADYADPLELTQKINDVLEAWIKEQPEQWFWVHRRWGKQ